MPKTENISKDEARRRAYKAGRLAKTAVDAGLNRDNSSLLDQPGMRRMILAATLRHPVLGSDPRWTAASDETWLQVKILVRIFG